MQFTGPPKLNDWTAPSTAYQTPLDAAWEDESEWVEYRSGRKEQAGTRKLRGRFFVAWTGLDYETAARILHELRGDTVTFTPRTQVDGEQVSIDVDDDGTDEEVLEEVAVSCRVTSELPTATDLKRQFTDGTQEARMEVELETLDTFEDVPGFIPAAADPANPQFTGIVSSFNGRTGDVSLSSSDVIDALGYTPADGGSVVSSTLVHERDPDDDAYWSWDETEDRWGQQIGTGAYQHPLLPARDEAVTGSYTYHNAHDMSPLGNDEAMIDGGPGAHRTLYAAQSPGLDVRVDTNDSGYAHLRWRRSSTADVFLEADTRNGVTGLKWMGNTVLTEANTGNLPGVDQDATVTGLWTFQPGLKLDGDAHIKGDGAGAMEVLAADGTNTGILRVDRAVINELEVVGSIDQTQVNTLEVADQYIIVNEGQTGTPTLDGGLKAERGDQADAVLVQWDEGLDDVVTGLEGQTLNRIVHEGNISDLVDDLYVNEDGDTMTGDLVMGNNSTQTSTAIHQADGVLELYEGGGGSTYGALNVGVLDATSWHLDLEEIQNLVASNRADGSLVAWVDANGRYQHFGVEALIDEFADTGIFNSIAVGGTHKVRSDTEPSAADFGESSIPLNAFWIDTSTEPSTLKRWDGSAWQTLTGGLIDGGLIIGDTLEVDKVDTNSLAADTAFIQSLTSEQAFIDELTASSAFITDLTAEQAFINEIENLVFTGQNATIERVLQVGTGNPHFLIDGVNTRFESSNYASMVSGFRIETDGFAEFGDGRFRGELVSTTFVNDQQVLRGGTDIVAPATTLAAEAPAGSNTLEVRTMLFSVGDDLRLKEGATSEVVTVQSVSGSTITLTSNLANTWTPGAGVVRWNAERIVHSADSEFAPFTSYVRPGNEEAIRIGNLEGTAGGEGFGMRLGENALVYYQNTLQMGSGTSIESGQFGGMTVNAGTIQRDGLIFNGQQRRVSFNSRYHDLDLSLGDFDRSSLPDVSEITGAHTVNPSFDNNVNGWQSDVDGDPFTNFSGFDVRPNKSIGGVYVQGRADGVEYPYEGHDFIEASNNPSSAARYTVGSERNVESGYRTLTLHEFASAGDQVIVVEGHPVIFDRPDDKYILFYTDRHPVHADKPDLTDEPWEIREVVSFTEYSNPDRTEITLASPIQWGWDTNSYVNFWTDFPLESDNLPPVPRGNSDRLYQSIDFSPIAGSEITLRFNFKITGKSTDDLEAIPSVAVDNVWRSFSQPYVKVLDGSGNQLWQAWEDIDLDDAAAGESKASVSASQHSEMSGPITTMTHQFEHTLTVPADGILVVSVACDSWAARGTDAQGETWYYPTHTDFLGVEVWDAVFNSVIAADGMTWRDTSNSATMLFDAKTGDMELGRGLGLFGTTPPTSAYAVSAGTNSDRLDAIETALQGIGLMN